jgi:hypothetical protein
MEATAKCPDIKKDLDQRAKTRTFRVILHDRYWVFPQPEWLDVIARRFEMITQQSNPTPAEKAPGMPPRSQLVAEIRSVLRIGTPS